MTAKIQPLSARELASSAPTLLSTSFEKLSDDELYHQAKFYGENALEWRRKFTGLLPEVQRRKLYERKGFTSILEFAKKLAGLSEKQVRTALNLDASFSDKPVLKSLLENGKVSVNKLVRIQSIATPENQSELAMVVKTLPREALETFVRDEKAFINEGECVQGFSKHNGLPKPLFDPKSLHVQPELQLNNELTERLLAMKNKGIDINKVLTELLDRRELEIEEEKSGIASELKETYSRYVAVRIRKVLKEEFGEKCSHPNCKKLAVELHHTQRFALVRTHDPRYLAPLCEGHHQLAHLLDQNYREKMARR